MKNTDLFQFRLTNTDNRDNDHDKRIDDLSGPIVGVEYDHKLEDVLISTYQTGGSSAAMLLPAVQSVREAPGTHAPGTTVPADTTTWDDFSFG